MSSFKPRILVIDDEPTIGDLVKRLLEQTGEYLVETESDAFAAMKRAKAFKPDLLIVDVNMPGRSGLEVAEMIRKEPWLCHRPIVFYTGMEATRRAALRSASEGPSVFLLKGGKPGELLQALETLLAERLRQYRGQKPAAG